MKSLASAGLFSFKQHLVVLPKSGRYSSLALGASESFDEEVKREAGAVV